MPSVLENMQKDAAGRKIALYIGGRNGALYTRYRGKEWYVVRASYDASLSPEIDLNTVCLGDVPHASIDAVWVADTLEHLPREKAEGLIRASHALVKKGGEWGGCAPDMEALATYIAGKRGQVALITMPDGQSMSAMELAFGRADAPHQQGFTPDSMAQLLLASGVGNATVTARALYLWIGSIVENGASDGRKVRIRRSGQAATPPATPPLAKQPHPGQFFPRILSDELDIAPKRYDGITKS